VIHGAPFLCRLIIPDSPLNYIITVNSILQHTGACLIFRLLKQCRQFFELKCELMGSLTGWLFSCLMTFIEHMMLNVLRGLQQLFPFSASTLLAGQQERHPVCKKLGVGLLVVTV